MLTRWKYLSNPLACFAVGIVAIIVFLLMLLLPGQNIHGELLTGVVIQ
jgi:hypothetical protein